MVSGTKSVGKLRWWVELRWWVRELWLNGWRIADWGGIGGRKGGGLGNWVIGGGSGGRTG